MRLEYRLPNVTDYKRLRDSVGWRDINEVPAEKALKNSLFSVVAVENGVVIGFGRIIGDSGLYYYIQDLIVHPEFQAKGLGKALMTELMNYINSNAKAGAFVGLMAGKGLEKYYEQFGFKACDADAPGMYQVIR